MAEPTGKESGELRLRGDLGAKPLPLHVEVYGRVTRALTALLGQDPTPIRNPTITLDERLQLMATVVDVSAAPFRKNGVAFAVPGINFAANVGETNALLLWNNADHLVAVQVDDLFYGSSNSTTIARYGLCFPPPLTSGGLDLLTQINVKAHYTENFVTPSSFVAANGRPGALKANVPYLLYGQLRGLGALEADNTGVDWHGHLYPQDPTGATEPRAPDTRNLKGETVIWPGCALLVQQSEVNKAMRVDVRGRIWDFGPKETRPIGG